MGTVGPVTTPAAGPTADTADDLALALAVADAADTITTDRFGAVDLRVESKPDLTPVSDADVSVERAVRGLLAGGAGLEGSTVVQAVAWSVVIGVGGYVWARALFRRERRL